MKDITLKFTEDIYNLSALEEAQQSFSEFFNIQIEKIDHYFHVHLIHKDQNPPENLIDEFTNYVLDGCL